MGIDQVAPGLYITDIPGINMAFQTGEPKFDAVLNLSQKQDPTFACETLSLDVEDQRPMTKQNYDAGMAFLRRNHSVLRKVCVHCMAGVNRSVSMACAFMVESGFAPDMESAFKLVRAARPECRVTAPADVMWDSVKAYLLGLPQPTVPPSWNKPPVSGDPSEALAQDEDTLRAFWRFIHERQQGLLIQFQAQRNK